MEKLLLYGSIQAAILMMFSCWWVQSSMKQPNVRAQQIMWMAGALLSILHFFSAFHFHHHWSHFHAYQSTASQTEELMGFRFGGGVYFNYLFILLWIADAIWLASRPEHYFRRPIALWYAINGYLLFITFNGAIVFASGFSRWFTSALLVILGVSEARNRILRNRS